MALGTVYRTTVRDSWRWMWWDIPGRLLPLTLAPIAVLWLTHTSPSAMGFSEQHLARDLLLAVPCGLAGFAIAAAFAEYLARRAGRWFVPDRGDLALQTFYYVGLNAFPEEWFFRGFLQGTLIRWWGVAWLGLAVATAVFGAYHLLGRWGWRPVGGATVAGLALGLVYLWQPHPPSLLLPVIVHACITAGFLSVGPYVIFAWRRSRGRIRPQVELPGAVS
ncbi:MAG TPA: CPBP family intramembrane glutamic endopeptidase [Candidatus Limnocylindrales bacterium]|nr:CPBP family intramembrane glutamic endopeptidase [Candidatus Limnocylindrales bacterium]